MSLFFSFYPTSEAFDTEACNGNLKVICSSKECFEPTENSEDLLDWLYDNALDLNWLYNISYDMSVILKPFHTDTNTKAMLSGEGIAIGKYTISYINNKSFTIRKNGRQKSKHFYDIAQFYREGSFIRTLDAVAKVELGYGKNNEELGIDRKRIGQEEGYYESNRQLIIKYCQNDAQLTLKLAQNRVQSVYELLGAAPKKWNSPASIAKAYLKLKHPDQTYSYPRLIQKLPVRRYHYFDLINQTYTAGIFWDSQLGNIGKVSELDLNSAYPKAISELKSIVDAEIKPIKNYDSTADYSFYKIRLTYTGEVPYPYRESTAGRQYHIIYPISIKPVITYSTGVELEYLNERHIPYTVIEGVGIYCKRDKPEFEDYKQLYERRKQLKKEGKKSMEYMLKLILNSTYGSFAQNRGGYTSNTNMVYASYITAKTRAAIYRKADEIGWENVRSIKTDAIIYSGAYRFNSLELGDFKQEWTQNEVISYFTGVSIRNGQLDTARGYHKLTAEALLKAEGNTLEVTETKVWKHKESIIQNRKEDIGKFEERTKTIHLMANTEKYILPVEEMTFQNMSKNPIQTRPKIIDKATARRDTPKEKYYNLMKQARFYKDSEAVAPDKLNERPDKAKERIFKKLRELRMPTDHRRQNVIRFLNSEGVERYFSGWKSVLLYRKLA